MKRFVMYISLVILALISFNPSLAICEPQMSQAELTAAVAEARKEAAAQNDGSSPLWFAKNAEVARQLIKEGVDVHAKNNNGNTAIRFAAREGCVDVVKALIEAGADVNVKNDKGVTPIYMAAQEGHVDVVKTLIAAGADVNVKDNDGFTPLTYATAFKTDGTFDIVKALLAAKAEPYASSNEGSDALYFASLDSNDMKILKALIAADPWKQGKDAAVGSLCFCIRKGKVDNVKNLIAAGVNVNGRNEFDYGRTPLYYAISNRRDEIVKILIKAGAKVNAPVDNFGNTPLMVAFTFKYNVNDVTKIARILIDAGADIRKKDGAGGRSALDMAIEDQEIYKDLMHYYKKL